MIYANLAPRFVLGLIFTIFGLNGFLNFIPVPPMPEAVQSFMGALMATGYFFPVLKATEVICGVLLLTNKFAALALIILAPIMIQIFLFHAFLTPGLQNLLMPAFIIICAILAARKMKDKYAALLKPN